MTILDEALEFARLIHRESELDLEISNSRLKYSASLIKSIEGVLNTIEEKGDK